MDNNFEVDISSLKLEPLVTFIGTCEEWMLFKTGTGIYGDGITPHEYNREYPIKGKTGDIYITSDTKRTYMWADNDWINIGSDHPDIDKPKTRYKKIIPYPTNCVNCGALLHDYICEACGTEHPSFEYIIEEE